MNRVALDGDGPMGPTRRVLGKPVIAAVEGHAVAGGLELALWCDLRVMADDAVLGVFCRRWGVPLIDGGTVRLPRLIGQGRALDLVLTGRSVGAEEALRHRPRHARRAVRHRARGGRRPRRTSSPRSPRRVCGTTGRRSTQQWDLPLADALRVETEFGIETLRAPERARRRGALRRWRRTPRRGRELIRRPAQPGSTTASIARVSRE